MAASAWSPKWNSTSTATPACAASSTKLPSTEQAYPEFREFAALKARVDPRGKFRNLLWDKYL